MKQQLHLPTQDSQTALQHNDDVTTQADAASHNSKGKRKRSKAKRDRPDEDDEASGLQLGRKRFKGLASRTIASATDSAASGHAFDAGDVGAGSWQRTSEEGHSH